MLNYCTKSLMQKIDKINLHKVIAKHKFIVIDKRVKDLYFQDDIDGVIYVVDKPEKSKNLVVFKEISSLFLKNGIHRNDEILAIGGGATSDLAGFVASTILRGVKWNVIPTTLLAMIDASIGGKVGINTAQGKNLIGSFHFPTNIYFYTPFLDSLDKEDYDSGLGELLKYCFLSSDIAVSMDLSLDELIYKCAEYKLDITSKDPLEGSGRIKLNLGHTFGHAIEALTSITHGTCVVIGLEIVFSLFDKEKLKLLKEYKEKLKVVTPEFKVPLDKVLSLLLLDKKNIDEDIRFVLPENIKKISLTDLKSKILEDSYANKYFN